MATQTRNDLVNKALGNLGLLSAGQTPEAEDFDAVDGHVEPLIAELEAREIVVIDDVDAIPNEWFLPLTILLADEAASDFGLPGMPSSQADPDPVASAERRLREVQYSRPTGEPQTTEYF